MKIINRIMISSALLVFLSLVSLLAGISMITFLFPADPGKEILDKDVFRSEEILARFDASAGDWDALNAQLDLYDYKLLVLEGDNIVFSTLSDSQCRIIDSLKPLKLEQSTLAGKVQKMTFAAVAKGTYSIFAVGGRADNLSFFSDFLQPFLINCLIIIAVILLLSQLFTRKMVWRILRPLNALSDGSKRIENGDFSKPVVYTGKDEFASVCTAFNQMQEHLLKEREKTAAYEKARTDLIAGISHDLRTPLTSVKGYIKGLRDGVANTPEKREQYLEIAYKKACDMDVLLQKLFYFSSLETGNLPLSLDREDLGDFARQFAENMRDELDYKNIKMTVDTTSVPHPVTIDTEQMRRVLLNLVENAIKYANAKSLVLRISVWRERDMEHLLFVDNGQGVPEEHLLHLFERFWRGDEARGTKNGEGWSQASPAARPSSPGSGLGLYIVKYIVEAHGGFVTAKNDNGLQIKISLPRGKEENL
ncbi:MAG: HAMP domain-containing sensor histidine kinase [Clostridiaceae bacterium]|nr:HAMP domain-containing sensor histidine kinase [Clostridiaceae bacterium]